MKIKTPRVGKRPRVQFYLSDELEAIWIANRQLAKQLRLRVDFNEAFRAWFEKENKEAWDYLDQEVKRREERAKAVAD